MTTVDPVPKLPQDPPAPEKIIIELTVTRHPEASPAEDYLVACETTGIPDNALGDAVIIEVVERFLATLKEQQANKKKEQSS